LAEGRPVGGDHLVQESDMQGQPRWLLLLLKQGQRQARAQYPL
jgi:hypothetical protein